MSYGDAMIIDLATVATVVALLVRFGRLSHSHPGTIYVLFHLYSFSWRLATLASGSGETLFSNVSPYIEPLREDEIVRAALIADAVLGMMTLGWLRASAVAARAPLVAGAVQRIRIDPRIMQWAAFFAIPVGLAGLVLFARIPGYDNTAIRASLGAWERSSYVTVIQAWTGLMLVALIYVYGFRPVLVVPMVAFLVLMGYQGFHRFRAVIPAILLVQIYLERAGRRWPTAKVTAILAAIALLFFPLKMIGRSLQDDRSWSEIGAHAREAIGEAVSGNSGDQTLLDQMAAYLVMMDDADVLFLGKPYLSVLTLWIPRQIWPDKPTLNWHIFEFARSYRPVAESGMVMSFIGDLYANFSWAGLFLVAPLLAYLMARVHFAARAGGYLTVLRFGYLLVACNLIQVYRDGLVSLFVFTFVNMLPLTVVIALHALLRPRTGPRPAPAPLAAGAERRAT